MAPNVLQSASKTNTRKQQKLQKQLFGKFDSNGQKFTKMDPMVIKYNHEFLSGE